ncbi:MAG TPA: 50S ribosomal protein L4 [Candidatus Kapabacteria bacterium]|jgi:large subunit ribosomal protein L4|nr:50S ribosomal protein L4 [Candidatus Kapabacteria bacterium]
MEVEVLSKAGSGTGRKIALSEDIFGIEPHEHSMWLAINTYLANQRQGTHKTLQRSEVSGSTKKLFRQKGTGRARQGSIKSGLHPGGATMFGPQPHKYTKSLPRKVKQLARKSALSEKVKNNAFVVVEDLNFDTPRTKQVQEVLNALNLDTKQSLLLTAGDNNMVYISGRNIPTLTVLSADKASMYEIWKSRAVIAEESAIKIIEDSFAGLAQEKPEVAHIAIPA